MRSRARGTAFRFVGLWLFIAVVSSYDAYLLVYYSDSIEYLESNPVGLYLISLGDGDIFVFLNCKAAGTIFVLGSLLVLYRRRPRWAIPVIHALAFFQGGLLFYLLFADHQPKLASAYSTVSPSDAEQVELDSGHDETSTSND